MNKPLRTLARGLFLVLILTSFAASTSAQPVPRAAPPNDNRANAMPIHPDATIIVSDVEQASSEGGEAGHGCHSGGANPGVKSVWFVFALPAGTLTLDTTGTAYNTVGTTSVDSIVSLYNFNTSLQLACNDNGAASAVLTQSITGGIYLAQVSAVAGTPVTLPSNVTLTITFTSSNYTSVNDSYASAAKLPLPGNMSMLFFSAGKLELGEALPTCSLEDRDSHSFWYKFTTTKDMTLVLATVQAYVLDYAENVIEGHTFALYAVPASGLPSPADEVECGPAGSLSISRLPAGSYVLRVSVDTPGGSNGALITSFHTVIAPYLNPSFEASDDALDVNDPVLAPFKVKGSNGGDAVVCGIAGATGDCAFRFTNSAGENTTLQLKVKTPDFKLKKSDFMYGVFQYRSAVVPDATITVTATYADGSKTVGTTVLTQQPTFASGVMELVPFKGKPVKIVLKLKNKTTVGTLEIDGILVAFSRIGTSTREVLAAPSAAVLPLPPPP